MQRFDDVDVDELLNFRTILPPGWDSRRIRSITRASGWVGATTSER